MRLQSKSLHRRTEGPRTPGHHRSLARRTQALPNGGTKSESIRPSSELGQMVFGMCLDGSWMVHGWFMGFRWISINFFERRTTCARQTSTRTTDDLWRLRICCVEGLSAYSIAFGFMFSLLDPTKRPGMLDAFTYVLPTNMVGLLRSWRLFLFRGTHDLMHIQQSA